MDINRRLQEIYGFTEGEVEIRLRWKDIFDARNNFFKQGKSINFHKDVEIYMQPLFLDLLRHEIGLQSIDACINWVDKLDLAPLTR